MFSVVKRALRERSREVADGHDMPECDGRSAPDRWRFWRPRRVYAGRGRERQPRRFRDHLTGTEATAARSLQIALPDGERLWQCGNGRWHEFPPRGVPFSSRCGWGMMEYYDARAAREAARRIRYRIRTAGSGWRSAGCCSPKAFADGAAWALARLVTLWPW